MNDVEFERIAHHAAETVSREADRIAEPESALAQMLAHPARGATNALYPVSVDHQSWDRRRSWVALASAAAIVALIAGVALISRSRDALLVTDSPPVSVGSSSLDEAAVPPSVDVARTPVARLELDDVAPVSAPLVLSEYLNGVQFAVRQEVGDNVFGGAVVTDADTDGVTITIYGTDVERVTDAVDRIAVDARERISVAEAIYSVNDLERFGNDAQRRLDAEGLEAYVVIRWGLDAVEVDLVTPTGEPDPAIESAAKTALGDLPVVIRFSSPVVPLGEGS